MISEEKHEELNEEMEARLWAYIDGIAAPQELSAIEGLIATQAAWRARYHELLHLHEALGSLELEEPSLRFTRNVMEEIARAQIAPAANKYINNRIIWGIALFFILSFLGFLVYGFAQLDWSAAADSKGTLGINFEKVDYSRMFNNDLLNIVMMTNVILALMLLDRYLSKKKHALRGS